MTPHAPHIIACAGLIASAAVAIGCPDRPYAFLGIALMTALFYSHAVGFIQRQMSAILEAAKSGQTLPK